LRSASATAWAAVITSISPVILFRDPGPEVGAAGSHARAVVEGQPQGPTKDLAIA